MLPKTKFKMKTRSQTNSLPPTPKRFNGIKYLTSLNDDEFSEDTTSQVTRFTRSIPEISTVGIQRFIFLMHYCDTTGESFFYFYITI